MDLETAAGVLGVHYQTAYRWVRAGILPAVMVGSEYELDAHEVERVAAQLRAPADPAEQGAVDWAKEAGQFVSDLIGGDELTVQRRVDELQAGGAPPLELCEELIAPALRELGEGCAAGNYPTALVAVAAGICERLIGSLASPPRGRPRGVAVVATPEGDGHRIPGLMATVALRADRWRVHHLGADVPTADLLELVADMVPDLVVLSLAQPHAGVATVEEHLASGAAVPVLVGAPGASLRRLLKEAHRAVAGHGDKR